MWSDPLGLGYPVDMQIFHTGLGFREVVVSRSIRSVKEWYRIRPVPPLTALWCWLPLLIALVFVMKTRPVVEVPPYEASLSLFNRLSRPQRIDDWNINSNLVAIPILIRHG